MARQKKVTPLPEEMDVNVPLPPMEFKFRYVFYIIGFILFLMALFSHTPQDAGLLSGGVSAKAYINWVGPWGAYVAQYAYYYLGLSIWPIVILCTVVLVRPFFAPPVHRRGYIPAMIMVIVGLAVIFALHPERCTHDFLLFRGTESLGIGYASAPERALSGGVLGQFLAGPPVPTMGIPAGVVRAYIGELGTMVSAVILMMFGFLIIFMCDWKTLVFRWLNSGMPQFETDEEESDMKIQVLNTAPSKKTSHGIESIEPGVPPPPPPIVEPEDIAVEVEDPSSFMPVPDKEEVEEVSLSNDSPRAMFIKPSRKNVAIVENTLQDEVPVTPLVPKFTPVDDPEETPYDAFSQSIESVSLASVHVNSPSLPKESTTPLQAVNDDLQRNATPNASASVKKLAHIDASLEPFVLPKSSMLKVVTESQQNCTEIIEMHKRILTETLLSFKIDCEVTNAVVGPRIIRYELSIASGIRVQRVEQITENIMKELQVETVRVIAPIPGTNKIGVEVPNPQEASVSLRQLMETPSWTDNKLEVPIILGKDISGKPYVADLARMPHVLLAGTTGAGKSVCLNTIIMSLLFKFSPDELRLIMVDPKVVEMAIYKTLPHLITPVVNDQEKVPLALRWGVNEMERRYRIMAECRVKNLVGFNTRHYVEDQLDSNGNPIPATMPYLVIIVDELADVMMSEAKKDVETAIAKIAQKGRAAGIHLILATQRPSTNIITGVIKANLPARIAFRVGSDIDSRVILGKNGAESLLGKGDMLFASGGVNIDRIQGAWVSDGEIDQVVQFISHQRDQRFLEDVIKDPNEEEAERNAKAAAQAKFVDDDDDMPFDDVNPVLEKYLMPGDGPNIRQALEILFAERKISTSYIQRRLGIGYNKAAEIIDKFEQRGIIGPSKDGGSKRDILIFDELNMNI